jgi:hypothetical protein
VIQVVANDRLERDTDPKFVEAAGEEEGIRVLAVRSQHLRANGDDFRDHRFSLALGFAGLQRGIVLYQGSTSVVPQSTRKCAALAAAGRVQEVDPRRFFNHAARLKSCPDTKLSS